MKNNLLTLQFLLLLLISYSVVGQNESEPNNTFGQADLVNTGAAINGFIQDAGDLDYFKFNVSEPGIMKFEITEVPFNIDLDLFIYLPDQQTLIRSSASTNEGQGFSIEVSTCDVGEHYFYIQDGTAGPNNAINLTESYNIIVSFLPFSSVDETECNNSFTDAAPLIFSDTIEALIAPWFNGINSTFMEDVDYYKVNVTEIGVIKLEVYNVPSNVDLDVLIYAPDQQTLIHRSAGTNEGQGVILEVSTCEIGEHYIYIEDGTVGDDQAYSCTEPYELVVDFLPFSIADEAECNNSFADAYLLNFSDSTSALIAPWFNGINSTFMEDVDYYKVNVTEIGVIKLEVYNVPSNVDLDVLIYAPDQQTLMHRSIGTNEGQGVILELSTCEIGDHYIYIEDGTVGDDQAYSCTEPYELVVDFLPFSIADEAECNNSFTDAYLLSFSDTTSALIAPWFNGINATFMEDSDYYKINVTEPGAVQLDVFNVPSGVDIDVFVYRPDQQTEIARSISTVEGQGALIEFSTCEIGEHYIYIEDGGTGDDQAYSCTEPYDFIVRFFAFSIVDPCECNNSFSEACPLTICDTTTAIIAPFFDDNNPDIADEDYYTITAEENAEVNIVINSVSSEINLCVDIFDASTSTLIEDFNGGAGQSIDFNFTAPQSGTYYIVVFDCGNNAYSFEPYNLYVAIRPQVDFASPIAELCIDSDPVQLTGGEPLGGVYTGAGVNGMGIFDPAVAGVNTHEITYTYTEPTSGCSSSVMGSITVHDLPDVSINFSNDIIELSDTPLTLMGGMPTGGIYSGVGVVDNIFSPSGAGDFVITYTYTDGFLCSNDTFATITVIQTINTSDLSDGMTIGLFPNPFDESLTIDLSDIDTENNHVEVYNATGQRCISTIQNVKTEWVISTSDWNPGVYLIHIIADGKTIVRKVLKY